MFLNDIGGLTVRDILEPPVLQAQKLPASIKILNITDGLLPVMFSDKKNSILNITGDQAASIK